MQKGDFIVIDYVARIKDNQQVFDTTKEEVAKKAGIFDASYKYKPLPIILGANWVIPGLEEELLKMKPGEKKKIVIKAEKAFGVRDEKLVKLLPISVFRKSDVKPMPGKYVSINNLRGKIISVDGGRVKVDFNHPLAGKDVEYEVEVKEKIEKEEEKIKAIIYFFTNVEDAKVKIIKNQEKIAEIESKLDFTPNAKKLIADHAKKWVNCKKIRFVTEL